MTTTNLLITGYSSRFDDKTLWSTARNTAYRSSQINIVADKNVTTTKLEPPSNNRANFGEHWEDILYSWPLPKFRVALRAI